MLCKVLKLTGANDTGERTCWYVPVLREMPVPRQALRTSQEGR